MEELKQNKQILVNCLKISSMTRSILVKIGSTRILKVALKMHVAPFCTLTAQIEPGPDNTAWL